MAKTKDVDFPCWLDTDTEIITKITLKYLKSFPEGKFVAYLGRPGTYTETGFLVFDMRPNMHKNTLIALKNIMTQTNYMISQDN